MHINVRWQYVIAFFIFYFIKEWYQVSSFNTLIFSLYQQTDYSFPKTNIIVLSNSENYPNFWSNIKSYNCYFLNIGKQLLLFSFLQKNISINFFYLRWSWPWRRHNKRKWRFQANNFHQRSRRQHHWSLLMTNIIWGETIPREIRKNECYYLWIC